MPPEFPATSSALEWIAFISSLVVLPPLTIGIIRKIKARLQNRIGPPVLQPFFDIIKLFCKNQTISQVASWLFRSIGAINLAVIVLIAFLVPWLSFKPLLPGADLFLIIYLFALARMFTILAALDNASAFGAFGASREAALSLLVEPASILSLASLAVLSKTSNLSTIFSASNTQLAFQPGLWLLVGIALLLASLVELSRMPVDDPTTHLELTMVHEAMILEASGKNLALIELAHAIRMTVLFGLCAQCFIHALPVVWNASEPARALISIVGLVVVAVVVATFESVAVKLQWRKVPEFIAYALTMSLFAALLAVGGGIVR